MSAPIRFRAVADWDPETEFETLAVGKRVMKEWIEVTAEDRETWRDLVVEAYAFVGGRGQPERLS